MGLFDLSTTFTGFTPSDFTRDYLQAILDKLGKETPGKSVIKASFVRNNKDFKGVVSIQCAAGDFFATAHGTRIKDVTHKIIHQLRHQIERRKKLNRDHTSLDSLDAMSADILTT